MTRLLTLLCAASLLATGQAEPLPEQRWSPAALQSLQASAIRDPFTAHSVERARRAEEVARVRATLALPAGPERDAALPGALYAIGLFHLDPAPALPALLASLKRLPSQPVDAQRALLSAAYRFYPQASRPALKRLLPRLTTPREFAIAAYAILAARPQEHDWLMAQLRQAFPDWQNEPRLFALATRLTTRPAPRPPLADLLAAPLTPGYPVVFSLQRQDRRHPGLVMVRGADGRFVREADGNLFHRPQLALASSNLPGTITLGNSPQGIYTIVGSGTADNPWIGPTPYLESKVPIEASLAEFAHRPVEGEWRLDHYLAWLPPSWRDYLPIREAWLAGRAGRSEMLMHGTTISPDYYAGTSWYPGTPSAGCLVASEYWGPDGTLMHSDQLALLKAFTRQGQDRGYLVVVELDTQAAPVSLAEVLPVISAVEARR
ncbi:hypothetical protein [Chitinimonas sp. BJYL2]|uniref:hypothetical protein n=1 Tax=Chitinimonas sp. BJYL2 TaxID=2976696 RepID=UPI0022B35556|nr:hypothetical protein [Chitinimonas sp. BJYL2]